MKIGEENNVDEFGRRIGYGFGYFGEYSLSALDLNKIDKGNYDELFQTNHLQYIWNGSHTVLPVAHHNVHPEDHRFRRSRDICSSDLCMLHIEPCCHLFSERISNIGSKHKIY